MANKTIPDLNQIAQGDVDSQCLVVIDDGAQTFKMTLAQLFDAIQGGSNSARTVTGSTTITDDDTVIRYNTAGGAIGQTLPAVATLRAGKVLILKNVGIAGNNLTITPNGSEKIDNLSSLVLAGDTDISDQVKIRNNGSGWDII